MEQFVVGPDRDDNSLDIDPVFGKSFDRVLREILSADPRSIEPESRLTSSDRVPGYAYQTVKEGVILRAPDGNLAGGYLGCDVSIAPEHQGKGLGAELVLERYLRFGDLPTWHLDKAAYTPAGLAAHQSAWRLSQDIGLVAKKLARLHEENRFDLNVSAESGEVVVDAEETPTPSSLPSRRM